MKYVVSRSLGGHGKVMSTHVCNRSGQTPAPEEQRRRLKPGLLDPLVGDGEQRRRHRETERLDRLQFVDELEPVA